MKKFSIVLIAIIIIGIAIAFVLANRTNDSANLTNPAPAPTPNSSTENESAPASATEVQVTIQNFAFDPKSITVKKGTKVTWTNQDSARHDVVSADGSPAGGPKGPLLAKGESYSHTFDTVGTFNYFCTPHPYMKASVIVTE